MCCCLERTRRGSEQVRRRSTRKPCASPSCINALLHPPSSHPMNILQMGLGSERSEIGASKALYWLPAHSGQSTRL
eukprot:10610853-Alexandrium_andersonii.AAC.1